jgi:hypothetical protein
MKLIDPVRTQPLHLLDGHIRRDHAPRVRIVIQPIEAGAQRSR